MQLLSFGVSFLLRLASYRHARSSRSRASEIVGRGQWRTSGTTAKRATKGACSRRGTEKQRAASGQLKPTDKVWKKGMAGWQAASEVEGLIPEPAHDEPPPIPPEPDGTAGPPPLDDAPDPLSFLNSSKPATAAPPAGLTTTSSATPRAQGFATKAKAAVSLAAQRGKAAAQLVGKQAERQKLANITLPAAYQALGKHIYDGDCYRDENAESFQIIDGLLADIAALHTPAGENEKGAGLAARAKAAAKTATDLARSAVEDEVGPCVCRTWKGRLRQARREEWPRRSGRSCVQRPHTA